MTLEQLDAKIAKTRTTLARYQEGCKSTNWEIANGSKLLVQHTETGLEILLLAKKGILA